MINTPDWPPPCTIKKYRSARNVKIRISALRGLVVSVPWRFNFNKLPAILEEHKEWIKQQLQKIYSSGYDELPITINFPCTQQSWKIHYENCEKSFELIEKPGYELVVIGRMIDKEIIRKKLITWIKGISRKYLSEQLLLFSRLTKLGYKNLTIRDQQTVWGSCTNDKSINLNYKLIFLPRHLIAYVIIHELCHTRHLNHSKKFWSLVGAFDPDWQQHRRELRQAHTVMPSWLV